VFGGKRRDERVVPRDERENAQQSAPAAPRGVSPGRVIVIPCDRRRGTNASGAGINTGGTVYAHTAELESHMRVVTLH